MPIGDGLKRLPSEPHMVRTKQFGLHMTDAEGALVTEAASRLGLKASAWVVQVALAAARELAVPADAEFSVVWGDGQFTYHADEDVMLASVDGQLDDLEPGESITITRIRKG